MKHARSDIGRFLRRCAQFFDEMSDSEVESFIEGRLKLALVREGHERPQPLARRPHDDEFASLIEQLRAAESRAEALRILNKDPRLAAKGGIVQLARALELHVNKHDKRETVEDRVVEAVVGVRLRSEAIQGMSLKASSPPRSPEQPSSAPVADSAPTAGTGSPRTPNGNDPV